MLKLPHIAKAPRNQTEAGEVMGFQEGTHRYALEVARARLGDRIPS